MILDRESKNCSVIGEDLTLEGNVISKSDLLIEGVIQGNVNCSNLFVSRGGRILGDVTCDSVELEGTVNGVITASRVDLKDGSILEGDIVSESLSIDHGATFTGAARPVKSGPKPDLREAAE